jgi:hypothetical protein
MSATSAVSKSANPTGASSSSNPEMTVSKHLLEDVLDWINAIGLSMRSPLPTGQSSAFFSTPATPWAYSALEITIASDPPSTARRSATAAGGFVGVQARVEWRNRREAAED